jgi:PqqD family protein of HPr-rel-A system
VAADDDVLTAWRGCNPRDVAWRCWGDETAVYDAATGSTHLLTASAGRLWRLLLEDPRARTAAELGRDARAAGIELDDDELEPCLRGLEAVGLVRSASH